MSKKIESFRYPYEFLSNFYPCTIRFLGHDYRTLEHAYQASKVTNKMDHLRMAGMPTAKDAKAFGRTLPAREDWDSVKLDVMKTLIRKKFKPGSELADRLLATGDAILIEGNWWGDTFWGKCAGKGENHLGKILMKHRKKLRNLQ